MAILECRPCRVAKSRIVDRMARNKPPFGRKTVRYVPNVTGVTCMEVVTYLANMRHEIYAISA